MTDAPHGQHANDHHGSDADHGHVGHVVPLPLLTGIFAALMVLTVITVGATWFDFGPQLNLLLAMFIALIKASLVVLYFMHLRWDRPVNAIVFLFSLFFVTVFIVFALLDSVAYTDNIETWRTEQVQAGQSFAPGFSESVGE